MSSTSPDEQVPLPGQWPVDPQEEQPISEDKIWVDGCFDFTHHGKKRNALSGPRTFLVCNLLTCYVL